MYGLTKVEVNSWPQGVQIIAAFLLGHRDTIKQSHANPIESDCIAFLFWKYHEDRVIPSGRF
jgi:hypothetical protein